MSDGAGLYRLTAAANDTVPAPLTGGRLTLLGDLLALSGDGGVWTRGGADGPWRELTAGGAEVVPTGDPRYPALLVGEGGAFLAEPAAGRLYPVALPVPARDVTAALLADGRLVLGTSGYGLLIADVAASPAAPNPTAVSRPARPAPPSSPIADLHRRRRRAELLAVDPHHLGQAGRQQGAVDQPHRPHRGAGRRRRRRTRAPGAPPPGRG